MNETESITPMTTPANPKPARCEGCGNGLDVRLVAGVWLCHPCALKAWFQAMKELR
jgi:ribosomal protein L37AE/L43A